VILVVDATRNENGIRRTTSASEAPWVQKAGIRKDLRNGATVKLASPNKVLTVSRPAQKPSSTLPERPRKTSWISSRTPLQLQ
jgi:hypothetical protein